LKKEKKEGAAATHLQPTRVRKTFLLGKKVEFLPPFPNFKKGREVIGGKRRDHFSPCDKEKEIGKKKKYKGRGDVAGSFSPQKKKGHWKRKEGGRGSTKTHLYFPSCRRRKKTLGREEKKDGRGGGVVLTHRVKKKKKGKRRRVSSLGGEEGGKSPGEEGKKR